MLRLHSGWWLLGAVFLFTAPTRAAEEVIFRGRVTLEDGASPGRLVTIQRVCEGLEQPVREGLASSKTGEYFVRLHVNAFGQVLSGVDMSVQMPCFLEASEKGFVSSRIDLTDPTVMRNPRLPDIVLTPAGRSTILGNDRGSGVPHAASKNWELAIKQLTARNWGAAEAPLKAVVEQAPKFAPGWAALGDLDFNLGKLEDARKSLEHAIELDPKPLFPYVSLADVEVQLQDWPAAKTTTEHLIAADTRHAYLEGQFLNAVALFQLHDFDAALERIQQAMRLDKMHELTRAEYVLGLIFEAKGDLTAAGAHMTAYVEQHPRAKDVAEAETRLANLGKNPVADLSAEVSTLDMRTAAAGEAPVPGGIKAFSQIARMSGSPGYQDFFLEYCRAIAVGGPTGTSPTREAIEEVDAFIAAVTALEDIGERHEDGTLIRISVKDEEHVRKSREILAALGWKLTLQDREYNVEPGERPDDPLREQTLPCFGIDELTLRQHIREKRDLTFEIPRENARLVGGSAWGVLLKGVPEAAGGPVEIFMKDWRFARTYAGLGSMDPDAAAALVTYVGLANLIVKYAQPMAEYADAITLSGKQIAVPGGVQAGAAWAKLTGANPQNQEAFLRALVDKDQSRLFAFYFDLSIADAAHRQYFTRTPERLAAYYQWYRDSAPTAHWPHTPERWQARILQKLPLNAEGRVVFPGGREVWASGSENDDAILLHLATLEPFAAIADLVEKRRAPLDAPSAALLAQRFGQWRNLFPYFQKLPALDQADFHALAVFADGAAKTPSARRNLLLGEWHSLVKLIVLGEQAGALSNARAAEAFRQACETMGTPNPSAGAIAELRALAGGPDNLDDAVALRLLRLSGRRLEAFDRVKKLQNVPAFEKLPDPPDDGQTLAALSGIVYAALLEPSYLLVAEDPQLLSKHKFIQADDPQHTLFSDSWLATSTEAPGSGFVGGFGTFEEAAGALRKQTEEEILPPPDPPPPLDRSGPAPPEERLAPNGPPPDGEPLFRAGARIVEVYTTVTDGHGRYQDNLTASQFGILEEGKQKPVFAFEDHTAAVSVALVFDCTGSMVRTLPPLKSAALRLVDDLRPIDSVSVYSFNDRVNQLQGFTLDKAVAKRAILKAHASGITALYDALVRVNHDLSGRAGKKVIIVFTDGDDNASTLMANTAINRAKASGIPIFTIAEGDALTNHELVSELAHISQATGGTPFLIRRTADIADVFAKLSRDLMHGYLVSFQPTPGSNGEWRHIQVVLTDGKGMQVRAREGYYAE